MDPFVRPKSAMGHRDEDESNVKDNLDDKYFGEQSNLFKGKSMPSLRYAKIHQYLSLINNSTGVHFENYIFPY